MNREDRKYANRLLKAADVLEKVPRALFDYETWGSQEKNAVCKTRACIAGHCSLDPWFRRNGFKGEWKLEEIDEKKHKHYSLSINGESAWNTDHEVREFFGKSNYKVFVPDVKDEPKENPLKGKTPKTLANSLRKYVKKKYGLPQ